MPPTTYHLLSHMPQATYHLLPRGGTNKLAIGLLAAVLAPYFLLSAFSRPAADDFVYAVRAQDTGFVAVQRLWYEHWTGRYFATALQSGLPLVIDMLRAYAVIPLATLAGLLGALALVARILNGRLREPLERGTVWLGVLGFAAIYITQMPSLVEGFYWLAGVATYEQALVLVLLLAACLASVTPDTSRSGLLGRMAAAALLGAAIAGSNETTFAMVDVLLLAGTIVAVRRKHPSRWVWIAALTACAAGSLVVAIAPGNTFRTMHFPKRPLAIRALHCAAMGGRQAIFWAVRPMLLGATILATGLAFRIVRRIGRSRRVTGRHVAMAAAANVGLAIVALAPAYCGMGRMPPLRALNVAYFFFLAGWFATLLLAVAWRQNVGDGRQDGRGEVRLPGWATVVGVVALVAGILLAGNWPGAVYDLAMLAPGFDREVRARYEILQTAAASGESNAAVERLSVRPASLLFGDIGDEPSQTEFIARYFGLSGLTVTLDGKPWTPQSSPSPSAPSGE